MSWAEFKVLSENIEKGIVSLPTLIIKDTLGIMQGKTLTITDENEYFTHQVVFPQGETVMVVTLEYMCEWEVSFVNEGSTVRLTATVDKVGGVILNTLVVVTSWANGTDAEIVQMVSFADSGVIDLSDYWHVGDERVVSLSTMSATEVGESHVAQDVVFVLMNIGGKTLTNAVDSGRTECSFIVGMKDCLKEKGYMKPGRNNTGGWTSSPRRTWCNSVFKAALPETLLPIFKQFQNKTSAGNRSSVINTDNDYFGLSSEIEVTGSAFRSYEGEGSQFTWYETAANRIKKVVSSDSGWWTRSPYRNDSENFCFSYTSGTTSVDYSGNAYGISPFGVI